MIEGGEGRERERESECVCVCVQTSMATAPVNGQLEQQQQSGANKRADNQLAIRTGEHTNGQTDRRTVATALGAGKCGYRAELGCTVTSSTDG